MFMGDWREGIHLTGYTFARACSQLEWLLADGRWKQCNPGFEDVNRFLDSLRGFSELRGAAEQRKRLAQQIKDLQPKASKSARMRRTAREKTDHRMDERRQDRRFSISIPSEAEMANRVRHASQEDRDRAREGARENVVLPFPPQQSKAEAVTAEEAAAMYRFRSLDPVPPDTVCLQCGETGDVLRLRDTRQPGSKSETLHLKCAATWFDAQSGPGST
jgi:hypothetical protein